MTEADVSSRDRGRPGRSNDHRGWHHRGYLPHFDAAGMLQMVTWHLADALPAHAIARMLADLPKDDQTSERREHLNALIDTGHGSCLLRDPTCAQIMQDSLGCFDGTRYLLQAWVIMPNHVHVLFQEVPGYSMTTVVGAWKSFTAHAINKMRTTEGPVWHPDYWDRYIRDAEHYAQAVAYIERNPVEAGLCKEVDDWRWSSAFSSGRDGRDPGGGDTPKNSQEYP